MTNLFLYFMPYQGPFRGYVETDSHLFPIICYLLLFAVLVSIILYKGK